MLSKASIAARDRHTTFWMALPTSIAKTYSDGGALMLTEEEREKRLFLRRRAKAQRKRNR